MEKISSRKNRIICHMRAVASDPAYRSEVGQFICDGEKTLREAIPMQTAVTGSLRSGDSAGTMA